MRVRCIIGRTQHQAAAVIDAAHASTPAGSNRIPPRPSPAARALALTQYLLIASGLLLLAAYGASRLHAHVGKAQAIDAFELALAEVQSQRAAEPDPPPVHAGTPDPAPVAAAAELAADPEPLSLALGNESPDKSLWSEKRIAAYEESLREHRETPLGILSIDRLNIRVPIFTGTSELALNRGLGHIEGTAPLDGLGGNAGIAGHRDGFFRSLEGIEIGDTIQVRSLDGNFSYRVDDLLIVEPEDVYVLNSTPDPSITLVTCYPFYFAGHAPQRFIVKATLQTTAPELASQG